ncbi:uncharacterized protein LOC143276947 [Babylonia areolata]|uniref:uncharacterized protein LOC143276947 n=1 Tax=Babylonia areolata TaxID=304850 RepID=UPI003FD05780
MSNNSGCCCACSRKSFYFVGLFLIGVGLLSTTWGFFSGSWVHRTGGSSLTADSVERYGLWGACSPDNFDTCGHITDRLPQVGAAAKGSQALLTLSVIFIVLGFIAEIIGCLPLSVVRGKCRPVFDNRVIEYVIAIATVVGFLGLLIFAGEVKNKASREIGQQDSTGRGFGFSISGQLIVVLGCCLLACGRDVAQGRSSSAATA